MIRTINDVTFQTILTSYILAAFYFTRCARIMEKRHCHTRDNDYSPDLLGLLFCNSSLPPAHQLLEGNVFTGVCHSVHGGQGIGPRGQDKALYPIPSGTDIQWCLSNHLRLASRQYTSYWNAFLLLNVFTHFK